MICFDKRLGFGELPLIGLDPTESRLSACSDPVIVLFYLRRVSVELCKRASVHLGVANTRKPERFAQTELAKFSITGSSSCLNCLVNDTAV